MKILIIRLSSIGDIILTEPVIRYLQEFYSGCQIDYLTKPQFTKIVQYFEGVNNIIPFETYRKMQMLLQDKKYDLLIDLHNKPKTWLVKQFISARVKVSYQKKHLLRRLMIKKLTNQTIDSTLQLYLTIFTRLKIDLQGNYYYPRLNLDLADEKTTMVNQLPELKAEKRLIAIFPGANHQTKQYPVDYFAQFINDLGQDKRYRFFILGSEDDRQLADQLERLCQVKLINWCGRFDLQQLVKVMNEFDVIITNDSGPMHITAALEKNQIAIFGATHPRLGFRPLNDKAIILQTELPCRPCSLHGGKQCPQKHFRCMKSITPQMLKKALLSFYQE